MDKIFDCISQSVAAIRERTPFTPEIGIILGTGLGKLADRVQREAEISYGDIPHFPLSTVETHTGKLILGLLSGKKVAVMQGRFHFYEGYTLQQVTYPVRVLKTLGIQTLIVSNACGGISRDLGHGRNIACNCWYPE